MGDNTFGPEAEAPVDLSALRPALGEAAGGAARWEALALRIERAAAPELVRRAAAGAPVVDLLPLLARTLRPALAAAAAAVLFAAGVGIGRRGAGAPTAGSSAMGALAEVSDTVPAGQLVSEAQVAQALRVGEAEATWLAEGAAPSRDALAQAVGRGAGDDTVAAPAGDARDSAGGGP